MHAWIAIPRNRLAGVVVALCLAACSGDDTEPRSGDVVSSASFVAPAPINADASLVVYRMQGISGALVEASTLVFVPRGAAPAGGWPIVAWLHGTTTVGQPSCAPSLSPTYLDGGLTTDGAPLGVRPSGYADLIGQLVAAGYAVVAPDLEGLGSVAKTAYPYYSLSSEARSLVAATRAAYQSTAGLSNRWAAVGHSDGGHGVLGVETYAGEAPELAYKGTVAFAPFTSISAQVKLLDTFAAADPANLVGYRASQNILVGIMAVGLAAQQPTFQASQVMGAELLALMPTVKNSCIFPAFVAVLTDIATKTPALFAGFKPGWDADPSMSAFLKANDPGVMNGFVLLKPTLVLQGTADPTVIESLVTALVVKLQAAGSTALTYKTYAGADHQNVVPIGTADMLGFLKTTLP